MMITIPDLMSVSSPRRSGGGGHFGVAGKTNELRQQWMIELFAELHQPRLRVIHHRDKPDAVVEVLGTTTRTGVECCELLLREDGRDRSLEAVVCEGMAELCQKLLGPAGEISVRLEKRPTDARQVRRWLAAFRGWLETNLDRMHDLGAMHHGVFPNGLEVAFAEAKFKLLGDEYKSELVVARDLSWLYVMEISILRRAGTGWRVYSFPGAKQLADRHGSDLDNLVVAAVAEKIRKASGYDFDGPLWLLVRSPMLARPTRHVRRRIAELTGITRFEEVWLLDVPANIMDHTRPPTLHALYP